MVSTAKRWNVHFKQKTVKSWYNLSIFISCHIFEIVVKQDFANYINFSVKNKTYKNLVKPVKVIFIAVKQTTINIFGTAVI